MSGAARRILRCTLLLLALLAAVQHSEAARPRAKTKPKGAPRSSVKASEAYNPARLNRLAIYSAAIRCNFSTVVNWSCATCKGLGPDAVMVGAELTTIGEDAFLVAYDKGIQSLVLVFRSTYGAIASTGYKNWMSNFLAVTTKQKFGSTEVNVHAGFYAAYYGDLRTRVVNQLRKGVNTHKTSNLWVVGHSRGGALSNIAALDIVLSLGDLGFTRRSVKLLTMGAPRVGDAAFVKLLESTVETRWRVVNNADGVPAMPPNPSTVPPSLWDTMKVALNGVLTEESKTLFNQISKLDNGYVHSGRTVVTIAYKLFWGGWAWNTLRCETGEDPMCETARWATVSSGRTYPVTTSVLVDDHSYYLGVDVNNQQCSANPRTSFF